MNATELVTKIRNLKEDSLHRLVLEPLYYSGARLHEVVEMIKGFDKFRLTCFDSKGFCRYFMGWYRGRIRCDYIYFPEHLLQLLIRYAGNIGDYRTVRKGLLNSMVSSRSSLRAVLLSSKQISVYF